MCLLSLRWKRGMAPSGSSSLQVVLIISAQVFPQQVFYLPVLEFWCQWLWWMMTGSIQRSRGTCKLKQKSWLHFAGVPLLFCPPEVHCANSHDLSFIYLHMYKYLTAQTKLTFSNVHKLPPTSTTSMVTLASSLQVCLAMGAYIFFIL